MIHRFPLPNLQSAGAEDARPLVLCHVGCRTALFCGDLLVFVRLVVALAGIGDGIGIATGDNVVFIVILRTSHVVVRRLGLRLIVIFGLFIEGGLIAK